MVAAAVMRAKATPNTASASAEARAMVAVMVVVVVIVVTVMGGGWCADCILTGSLGCTSRIAPSPP